MWPFQKEQLEVRMDSHKKTLAHPTQRRCTIVLGLHLPDFCILPSWDRSQSGCHTYLNYSQLVCLLRLFWQFQTVCINSAELPIETASPVDPSGVEFCRLVHLKIFEIYAYPVELSAALFFHVLKKRHIGLKASTEVQWWLKTFRFRGWRSTRITWPLQSDKALWTRLRLVELACLKRCLPATGNVKKM